MILISGMYKTRKRLFSMRIRVSVDCRKLILFEIYCICEVASNFELLCLSYALIG